MAERGVLLTTFGLLHKVVKKTQEKNVNFKSSLETINGTPEYLRPLLNEKVVVDLPPEQILDFKSEMNKGVKLVEECSEEVREVNIIQEKLENLDETLQKLVQRIQEERNSKEISIKVEELDDVKESNTELGVVDSGNASKTADTGKKDLVEGDGVGQAFRTLREAATDTKMKNMTFKLTLEKLNAKIEALGPGLEDIEQTNKKLHLPQSEISGFKTEIENGAKLIRKCSEVHGYNIFKKSIYKVKLEELDETLQSLIQIQIVQGMRKTRKMVPEMQGATLC